MAIKATDEQQAIIDHVETGDSLIVSAFAGTGKTSTLDLVSRAVEKSAIYIAFNRSVADDAQRRFPSNVQASTAHSLALKQIYPGTNLTFGKIFLPRIKPAMEVRQAIIDLLGKQIFGIGSKAQITVIRDTLARFCQSDSTEIKPYHVPRDAIASVEISGGDPASFARTVAAYAQKVWNEMSDINSKFPVTHDVYLKAWELGKPELDCSLLFFDEAQDANPVMLSIVKKQSMQRVLVGDQYQAIYAWRGAENAMHQFHEFHELPLTASWRFGQGIADEGQRFLRLRGEARQLKGLADHKSVVVDDEDSEIVVRPKAIISRTNFGMIDTATSLIRNNKKVMVIGGAKSAIELLEEGWKFKQGEKFYHPEFQYFKAWEDLLEHVETQDGQQLKPIVEYLDNQSEESMQETLHMLKAGTTDNPKEADITLTTAHRAKGLEWETVRLAKDWSMRISLITKLRRLPRDEEIAAGDIRVEDGDYYKLNKEFCNLCYVAVTRAEKELDGNGSLDVFETAMRRWRLMEQLPPDTRFKVAA